ncbi:MAG: DUF5666 domain-containing protein [Betaproteobacteria bacterium]
MKRHLTSAASASCLLLALLLQGCGGGSSPSSGAPAGAAQWADGLITGFGSVFVDGVELEDAKASVVTENADGSSTNSVLQMGQRVRVNHDGKGTASKVTVDAAVIGAVSNINATALTLTVAGQAVSINNDANAGPLTVWGGGYSSISDISNGDLIEVHGNPVFDVGTSTYKVVATRVQKMAAISSLKVNGKVSNLNTSAKTFSLNGLNVAYGSAALRPTGASLANDLQVSVFGPSSGLVGSTLTASHLKIKRLQDELSTDTTLQIGGQVSAFDNSAKTFEVQGVKVSFTSTTVISPSSAAVANNAYVQVSGTVGSDGRVTATRIQVREQNTNNDLAKVKLIGVISDFVDARSFVVRGVPVDASAINAVTACPGITLANNVPVQIVASQQAGTPVVLASNLTCPPPPALMIRPVDGLVSAVDATAKTFLLTPSTGSAVTVQWTDTTAFAGLTASGLSGMQIRVQAYQSGSTLVARVVSVSEAGLDDDHYRPRPDAPAAQAQEWARYRQSHPGRP